MSDKLLLKLFQRHFARPDEAVQHFKESLAVIKQPFSLESQLRELIYPPQPGLPSGLPSLIHYYVPGTRQGSDQPTPISPLHPSFIKAADGIGLNIGCPLRLLRALDALSQLSPADQQTPLACLRDPTQHLATVEELLWLTGWQATQSERGGRLAGMNGDIDWKLEASGRNLYLEAKFRRSDWVRLADHETFVNAGDGFLSKATHKFPAIADKSNLHVVGITTFNDISEDIVYLLEKELEAAPQIHAVVIRSLLQMTHVLSLNAEMAKFVFSVLAVPSGANLPCHYPVFFHIEQRNERRKKRPPLQNTNTPSRVIHRVLPPVNITKIEMPEPSLYRLAIPSRGSDGEPHFQMIPKYLFV